MSRHLMVEPGRIGAQARHIEAQLKGVLVNYMSGLLDYDSALEKGKRIISDEYDVMLRITRGRIIVATGKTVELPPEQQARMDAWRDDAVKQFRQILDDAPRG